MKQLTEHQINFILDKFFPTYEYAGAREIGRNLLTNGTCIVAGTRAIQLTNVTCYIHTEKAENLVDCLKYTFDLDGFLNSQYFKGRVQSHIAKFKKDKEKLQTEYKQNLNKLIRENEDICKF